VHVRASVVRSLLGGVVRTSVSIGVLSTLSGLFASGSGGLFRAASVASHIAVTRGGSLGLAAARSATRHLTVSDVVLFVLVLVTTSGLVSKVGSLKASNRAFSDAVIITLLQLALLVALEVQLTQSSVTMSGVGLILSLGKTVLTCFVGESGELLFFLLLLKATLLLFSFLEGLFLSTFELGFTNSLLDRFASEVHLGHVHDQITQYE